MAYQQSIQKKHIGYFPCFHLARGPLSFTQKEMGLVI